MSEKEHRQKVERQFRNLKKKSTVGNTERIMERVEVRGEYEERVIHHHSHDARHMEGTE